MRIPPAALFLLQESKPRTMPRGERPARGRKCERFVGIDAQERQQRMMMPATVAPAGGVPLDRIAAKGASKEDCGVRARTLVGKISHKIAFEPASAPRPLFLAPAMNFLRIAFVFATLPFSSLLASPLSLALEPAGEPKNKHVVLLSGDEEYRSEESMPMLAKILSQRHGFRCTVLFALDPDGIINPDNIRSLPDAAALDSADVIIMALRWREYPDDQMKYFVDAYRRGVPIIALRTSTHAFKNSTGRYIDFAKFGENVLGEEWIDHWGHHNHEATRAVIEPGAENDPLLNGVREIFGPTDVYEVYPPSDVKVLLRGQVLAGMTPDSPPATHRKKRQSDRNEQPVNDPMMPLVWTRLHRNDAGRENKVLASTIGASVDLESEDLRRLIVNGVYWGLDLPVPERADVAFVDPFEARDFGSTIHGYKRGMRPADFGLGK
jgi:hypothetical protein